MKIGKVIIVFVAIILIGAVLVGGCVWSGYNRAVTLDENVSSAWAQVENQLQRRFELIPNLVETVKGVAGQEEKIYLGVAEARKAYFQAKSVSEKARANNLLGVSVSGLLRLTEQYPELKSNEAFMKLQDSVEGTENRLAVERKRYNDGVRQLNTFIRKLTGRFYASMANVQPAEYFEVEEEAKTAPKVDFSDKP